MSIWFMWTMTALNVFAAAALFFDRQYPLAIMYMCYAIATAAMTWVAK